MKTGLLLKHVLFDMSLQTTQFPLMMVLWINMFPMGRELQMMTLLKCVEVIVLLEIPECVLGVL